MKTFRTGLWCQFIGGGFLVILLGLSGCEGDDSIPRPPVAHYATAAAAGNSSPTLIGTSDSGSLVATVTVGAPGVASDATPLMVTTTPVPTSPTPPAAFDAIALSARMLDLINRDRAAAGLGPVAWDETAARAGALHAADMIARGFFSHWNPDGLGPDHRYSAAGGAHVARENLYTFSLTFEDGRGAPIDDWPAVIDRAQAELMNSPGHRANILDPSHTGVGIGLAYDAATGQLRLAQEFTNNHATLNTPLPAEARPGDVLRVAGSFGPAAVGGGILDLAYEGFPAPLTAAELAARSTYTSAAQSVGDGRGIGPTFDEMITLPAAPGFYHVRLFVDLASGQAQVLNHVITVR